MLLEIAGYIVNTDHIVLIKEMDCIDRNRENPEYQLGEIRIAGIEHDIHLSEEDMKRVRKAMTTVDAELQVAHDRMIFCGEIVEINGVGPLKIVKIIQQSPSSVMIYATKE